MSPVVRLLVGAALNYWLGPPSPVGGHPPRPLLAHVRDQIASCVLVEFLGQTLLKSHIRKLGDAYKPAVVVHDNLFRTIRIFQPLHMIQKLITAIRVEFRISGVKCARRTGYDLPIVYASFTPVRIVREPSRFRQASFARNASHCNERNEPDQHARFHSSWPR